MKSVASCGLSACVLLLAAVSAAAQTQTGEIFGRVTDSTGAILPGATVTIQSPALIRPQTSVAGETGGYRFPNLPIGVYAVAFELAGFKRLVRENVRIETGFNAEINAKLEISTVQETVTVSAESPVVDTKQTKTGQTFSHEMLDFIPSARDPWVILEQTPGIVMDRQNVGGSESGQQSSFTVHGGNTGNTMWNVDGVTITDMAATGASPTYYDFDSFQEIQIQTGGNDASLQTGGISLNMITKSGGDRFRGSGRVFLVDDRLQANNITEELFAQEASAGNPIKEIQDYGFEIGGPIYRGRAWFWGGYGKQDITVGVVDFYHAGECERFYQSANRTFANLGAIQDCLAPDLTVLENYNAKLQVQPATPHKFTFLYTRGDKIRNARGASATTRIESAFRQSGPADLYKLAHQWIASDRMTIESTAAYVDMGFVLDFQRPELADVQRFFDIDTNVLSRSGSRSGPFVRPETEIKTDGHYFQSGWLGGDHAMKFGVRWRNTPDDSASHIGGNATARVDGGRPVEADLSRDAFTAKEMTNVSAYVNDSFTRGRLTLNLGVRVDHQDDALKAASIPANPIVPDLLPAVDFGGADSGVTYTDWSPRFGVTLDLTGNGKTVAKASAAVYYGQGIFTAEHLNPINAVTLRYPWTDRNGDLLVERSELNLSRLLTFSGNYNPANPASPTTGNRVDPALKNDRTREIIGGIDHELAPDFAVGANYIYRRYDDFLRDDVPIGLSMSDYVPRTESYACGNQTCDETSYQVTFYELPFRIPADDLLANDPYFRTFNGLELTARKRYSNRWMLNGSVALGSTVGRFPGDASWAGNLDPTAREFVDGAQENTRNSRWIVKLSGMYSLPWDVNVSAFLNARQGFPFFRSIRTRTRTGAIGRINAKYEEDATTRHENLVMLDARVEKWFRIRALRFAASLDVFNLGNANVVLDREGRQNVSSANRVFEVLAPRVARAGIRITF